MNMFLHELKSYRKSTIIWTFSIVLITIFFLSIYPAYANNAEDVKKLLQGYSDNVLKAAGVNVSTLFTMIGFYSFVFGYILLCGAIQAMNLGTAILSKEIREKTADFLLTKPVSRESVMTAKLLAGLVCLVITNAFFLITAHLMATKVKIDDYDIKVFLMISVTMFFVQLMFFSLGIIISVIVGKIRSVLAVSLGTVFGFFVISMINSIIGDKNLRYLSPFNYFDSSYIARNSAYETSFAVVAVILVVGFIVSSYVIYSNKDIHAV